MKNFALFILLIINTIGYSQTSVEEDWVLHFPPVLDYETFNIVDMEKDDQGNLYLLEIREVAGINECTIVKIAMSSWIIEWVVYFDVNGYESERAIDLEVDYLGNCIVSGSGRSSENDYGFITVKYNPSGMQEWVATYKSAFNTSDWINDLFIDNLGNAYVTGGSHEESDSYANATTIKYNSDGDMQWKASYVNSNIFNDQGIGLVVDDYGNVYVAGNTNAASLQFLTIKYNAAGVEQWVNIDGSSIMNDYAQFIGLDSSGRIFVGGAAVEPAPSYRVKGYLIYKYNPDGSIAGGGSTYNSYSAMKGMVVSPQGNIYVTGSPSGITGQSIDFVTVKFNSSATFEWEKRFNYAEYDWPEEIIIDENENILVTGSSRIPSVKTFAVTVKYNSSGDSLWSNIYSHQNMETTSAQKFILDESGDLIVAAYYNSGDTSGNELFKLNNSGVHQWTYNYKGISQPSSMKKDSKGNIYITGFGGFNQSMWDYITMKCDSSGNTKWVRTYNGPAEETDQAEDIQLDKEGNIYVTGGSKGIGTDFDFATIKYDSSGNELWVVRYNGPAFESDIADHIRIDIDGNVFVSGSSLSSNNSYDIATVKYNKLGQLQWAKRYNGTADGNDLSQGLELDIAGNAYISGTSDSTGSLYDYVTLKYNPSGDTEWTKRYNGPASDGDLVISMALDNSGNVYVTGWSFGNGTQSDYATVKYDSSGVEQWAERWDDPASSYDYANDIEVDGVGNVYVTGISQGMGTGNDYTTVKYNASGEQQWAVPYNSQSNGNDIANHIALDHSGEIYVSGTVDDNHAITMVKYNTEGIQQWEKEYAVDNYQQMPTDLLVDKTGHIYMVGNSYNSDERFWSIVKYHQDGFIQTDMDEQKTTTSNSILLQNFPNPFGSSSTTISYSVPASSFTTLKVYNTMGIPIQTLVSEYKTQGEYQVNFYPGNAPDGVYFIQLYIGDKIIETRKILLVK